LAHLWGPCDDPGPSKPAFLVTKNAEHPVAAEVAALDRYIDRFVWRGRSAPTAKRCYGIYGIPHWKTNRGSADPGKKARLHIWRPYDYRRIFAMYFAMYRIARDHPHIPTQLGADTACIIVVDDPVFGRICYGGGLAQEMARLPLPRATASGGG
jgi:hypothetical protein